VKPIVIVGAGLAGWTVVRELRKLDKNVPLIMIAADSADFYAKPMLSNALAAGKAVEQLVQTPAATMAANLAVELKAHCRVAGTDRGRQAMTLSDGSELHYGRLVLALGADPIRLPIGGDAADQIVSVNDLADYGRFRQRLAKLDAAAGGRLAILGAGLIGCEFANDLCAELPGGSKIQVSVFDPSPQALGRLLPPAAAEFYQARLGAVGIDFHFGRSIATVEHYGGAYRLTADNGEVSSAHLVLSAVGLRPRTQLASEAGLSIGRGIRTDSFLATDDPAIFALGDCAEVAGLNLPFVLPIMHAARALAATLAGQPTAVLYPAMPVVVKTPACPTVVAPPAAGADGRWQEERLANGVRSLFRATDGGLLGFALCGDAAAERQALTRELPATLA
jgi:rubredoxin-NAD+ reductase